MTNTEDPRQVLNDSRMTGPQILVVAITIFLNALDGFDILSIAFASPGIAAEWSISQTNLGIVLSMELIGMAIGSFLLGGLGDKIGRRPTVMICLVVMAFGMFMATTATSPATLSLWRIFTGLGIGGMLACTNAVVAEFANKKWRSLCISLMVIGYPLGGTFGGMLASNLLATYEWRSVFYLGAIATAALLPVVYWFVPESVHWLVRKQPAGALEKTNAALRKLGYRAVAALPTIDIADRKRSVADIFSPGLVAITLMVTAAFFFHSTTFFFILKWTPKIVADLGFAASNAGYVLTYANLGGALGGAIFGLLSTRIGLKPLAIGILVLAAAGVTAFGWTPADLGSMAFLAGLAGFFGNAGMSGLYSLMAVTFPTHVRATATGFVIGVGRGGSVLSPILAGILLDSGLVLPVTAFLMGLGSLLAAIVLFFLKSGTDRPAEADTGTTASTRENIVGRSQPSPA